MLEQKIKDINGVEIQSPVKREKSLDESNLFIPHFKQVTYKIEIIKLTSKVPLEFHADFIEWLGFKALEFGLGKHLEHYYGHDETGNSWIEVSFSVST